MFKLLSTLLTFAILPSSALAATVTAESTAAMIAPGGSATVSVNLVLDAAEAASLHELTLDLTGVGTAVTSVVLTPCGGWEGLQDGTLSSVQATLSCTAAAQNQIGTLLSAELTVTGLAPGSWEVRLGAGSFAQRDTDTAPFVEDVPLSPAPGMLLATLTVPEPNQLLSLAAGCIFLVWVAQRRKYAW
jgi:hypothetical protein